MSGRKAKLSVPSRFTINAITEIKNSALELLEGQNDVVFDVDRVKTVDTAGLQVLLSLRQALLANDRNVIWNTPSEEFMKAVELSGLAEDLGLSAA